MRAPRYFLLCFSLLFAAAVFATPDPILTFEEKAVVARVTPGASTAWFGLASDPSAYTPKTSEYARILVDTDNDGLVRFDLDEPKPIAVWMVVDMSNGKRTIASPAGVVASRKALPPGALKRRGGNARAAVAMDGETLAVCWVVRPGAGAWRMMAKDGASDDADGRSDGSVNAELKGLRAVGKSPEPPDDFEPGDIVVIVALDSLAITEVRVEKAYP